MVTRKFRKNILIFVGKCSTFPYYYYQYQHIKNGHIQIHKLLQIVYSIDGFYFLNTNLETRVFLSQKKFLVFIQEKFFFIHL